MKTIPISPVQEQFWIQEQLYPGNTAFHIPALISFRGIPDVSVLESSLNILIDRHEILRAVIREGNPKPALEVFEPGEKHFIPGVVTLQQVFNEKDIPGEVFSEIHKPFDLGSWPLMRFKLYIFNNNMSLLCLVFPHIIVDLHSKNILSQELSRLYNDGIHRKEPALREAPSGYTEFSQWYLNWMESEDAREMEEYWKKELPAEAGKFILPYDFDPPATPDLSGKKLYFEVGGALSKSIKEFARSTALNAFTVMLTAYAILLHRLTGNKFITIDVPLTNRRKEKFKDTFGCFVNPVPVKADFSNDPFGLNVLKQIRMSMLKAHRNQEIPLNSLFRLLKKEPEPVFRTGFTFEPLLNFSFEGLPSAAIPVERKGAQAQLYFTLWEDIKGFNGYCEYSSQLFTEHTAGLFTEAYRDILTEFVKMPNLRAGQFLTPAVKENNK